MAFFDRLAQSADLVEGMAHRLDIDLGEEMTRDPGRVAMSFRNMTLRCARCGAQDDCKALQAANAQLEQAPDYCRNGDVLRRN